MEGYNDQEKEKYEGPFIFQEVDESTIASKPIRTQYFEETDLKDQLKQLYGEEALPYLPKPS